MWLGGQARKLRHSSDSWKNRVLVKRLERASRAYARYAGVPLANGDLISTTIIAREKHEDFCATAVTVVSHGSRTTQIFYEEQPLT